MIVITTRRRIAELKRALAKLADACAQTLPGSAWSYEMDDALERASYFVGPMADAEPEPWRWITRRRRQRAREDAAWADGYHFGDEEVEEAIAEKDAFIAEQAAIITQLLDLGAIEYQRVPQDLMQRLADYV